MNLIKSTLLFSALILLSTACHKREYWGLRGKGPEVTEIRDVAGFSAIHLSCSADVVYKQDSVFKVEVSGQSNILDVLKTEKRGSELLIDFDRNVWDHKKITVVVHCPEMTAMTISGSGNIMATGDVHSNGIALYISGSGKISLPSLEATRAEAKISGSGNIEILGGHAPTTVFTISGSGNIGAEYLESNNCTATISGSGNITVYVTETLKGTISGSGDLRYRGNPQTDINISGSGRVRHI
jgi:hypothetical protein